MIPHSGQLVRKDRCAYPVFFLVAFFLLLWGLGVRSLWASEGRWAEITREMLTTGDFFHPTIGGEPYFDKPLLTYWLIAAISVVSNRLDEFIVRLPSAIAAAIAVAGTIYLGRRLWSRQVGWLAGGLLLTSYGLLNYSHVASAETENLAAVVLAVAWYWARRERPGFVTFLVFYLIMFAGSHMKGLTAFVVPVLAVAPDLVRQRRWRCLLWPSHWVALAIGVAVYFLPFVYATLTQPETYDQSGLALVFQENIRRYINPIDHKRPFYLYLYAVPLLTMPWIPIFTGALVTSVPNWRKLEAHTRWLLEAILVIFLFFTLSGSRRGYYILPILPFCTLLMAVFLTETREIIVGKHQQRGLRIQKHILIVVAILEVVLGPVAIWILVKSKGWELPSGLFASFTIIGLAALLAGILANRVSGRMPGGIQLQTVWALILVAAILMGGFYGWQYNILGTCRTERPFARQMKELVESLPRDRVAFWHRHQDKQLFYLELNPPVPLLDDKTAVQTFLESGQPGLIISETKYITEEVAAMLPPEPAYIEARQPWEPADKDREKLRAWLVNPSGLKTAMEGEEVTYAE